MSSPDLLNFSFRLLIPELYQFILVLLLFLVCLAPKDKTALLKFELLLPVLAATGFVISLISLKVDGLGAESSQQMFWNSYRIDVLSQFFKVLVSGAFLVTMINATRQPTLAAEKRPDYFLFLTMSAWGLMIMASAVELVTIYLAMELASYSLYILIPLRAKEQGAAEAGLKYILFGAAATALALYGLSWIIVSQGSTYLNVLVAADWSFSGQPLAVVGLCLFLGGMFYKLALFPFHFWCPDVYQGASNETATFVATLPKLGAIVVLIRLAALIPGVDVTTVLAWLAVFSMTFGNLCALAQKDLKRMLGFSSVAHAGYVLVGLLSGTPEGLAASAYYALAYLVMNLLIFWIISRLSSDGRNLTYDDLNGLSKRSPWTAIALTVAAFSLVGLPPTVGFIGKLWLLSSAWGHGYNWVVIILCLNSAIAIYYYLSLVRYAYTEDSQAKAGEPSLDTADTSSPFSMGGTVVLATLTVLLGIIPGPIYGLLLTASNTLLAKM